MGTQTKRAAPYSGNGSIQNVMLGGLDETNFKQSLKLPQEQIDELISLLPAKANQAKRFVQLLGEQPYATTDLCNKVVLSVNLSDLAVKYNPYLKSVGYQIRCRLPERLIKNRLGEPTMIHEWFLKEVSHG